jgi:hypothetical protein
VEQQSPETRPRVPSGSDQPTRVARHKRIPLRAPQHQRHGYSVGNPARRPISRSLKGAARNSRQILRAASQAQLVPNVGQQRRDFPPADLDGFGGFRQA